MNFTMEPRERLVCIGCRKPVRWAGKWRHTQTAEHEARAVTFPRPYYKVGASVSQDR